MKYNNSKWHFNIRQKKEVLAINRVILITGVLFCGLTFCALGQTDAPADSAAQAVKPVIEDEATRQLRIYSDALTHGVSESIRLDAAMGLLIRKDQASRVILLEALALTDNIPAASAVCQALIKGRSLGSAVGSIDSFLQPLITVLKSPDVALSRLAAEALLAFPFEKISSPVTELIHNQNSEKQLRLNLIYTLQIRPEPEALQILVGLLDDSDAEIVRASELALQESFGMPIGTGKKVWIKVLNELGQKKPAEINRERLLRQENRLRAVQAERDLWEKLYLESLDKEFELLDAAARSVYLQERLTSEIPEIRLWALDKVQRVTAESADVFRSKLLALLSDESREVRLAAAKTLSTMSALNPAESLLQQYKQENDPHVSLAIFEALGEACFFAFSPGSKITLPVEIKTQTLQIADSYASKEDPEMAKKGSEVLRKLLELNGLTQKETEYYLQTILNRYNLETQKKGPIRGDLLTVMARLCGQSNSHDIAVSLYRNVFETILQTSDDNSLVRQAAAIGMVNVDKTAAMQLFRQIGLQNDPSIAVLQVYIDLAGQSGTADDLEWLFGRFSANGQSDQIWDAMLDILKRQDAGVVAAWAMRLEQSPALPDAYRELLSLAEQKAEAQKEVLLLCDLQSRLLRIAADKKSYEQVAVYREKLEKMDHANTAVQQALRQSDSQALEAYLQLRKFTPAAQIMGDLLRENKVSDTSLILDIISVFMASEKSPIEDKRTLLKELSELTVNNDQKWWNEVMERWRSSVVADPIISEPNAVEQKNL